METVDAWLVHDHFKRALQVVIGTPQAPRLTAIRGGPQLHFGHARRPDRIDVVGQLETSGIGDLRALARWQHAAQGIRCRTVRCRRGDTRRRAVGRCWPGRIRRRRRGRRVRGRRPWGGWWPGGRRRVRRHRERCGRRGVGRWNAQVRRSELALGGGSGCGRRRHERSLVKSRRFRTGRRGCWPRIVTRPGNGTFTRLPRAGKRIGQTRGQIRPRSRTGGRRGRQQQSSVHDRQVAGAIAHFSPHVNRRRTRLG